MPFISQIECEKAYGFDELLMVLKKSLKGKFQIFDCNAILSESHLLFAYESAKRSFDEKRNISNSLEMEILLKVSATTKINEAILRGGFKKSKCFVLLCFETPSLPKEWTTTELIKSKEKELEIAKRFNLDANYIQTCGSIENALFETIAVSQL